jgi:hypothetical protein
MFAAATAFFQNFGKGGKTEEPPKEEKDPIVPANDNEKFAQLNAAIGEGFTKLSAAMAAQGAELTGKFDKLRGDHDALKASVERTDGSPGTRRAPAAGERGKFAQTDC